MKLKKENYIILGVGATIALSICVLSLSSTLKPVRAQVISSNAIEQVKIDNLSKRRKYQVTFRAESPHGDLVSSIDGTKVILNPDDRYRNEPLYVSLDLESHLVGDEDALLSLMCTSRSLDDRSIVISSVSLPRELMGMKRVEISDTLESGMSLGSEAEVARYILPDSTFLKIFASVTEEI